MLGQLKACMDILWGGDRYFMAIRGLSWLATFP